MRSWMAARGGGPVALPVLAAEVGWGTEQRRLFGRLERFVKHSRDLWSHGGMAGVRQLRDWQAVRKRVDGAEALRVVELFSGIGGLRAAFHRACALAGGALDAPREWVPLEASHLANGVYTRNFTVPYAPLLPFDIRRLGPDSVEGADLWLLSPPCQPFSRLGRRLDSDDLRAAPLLHLAALLPRLRRPPSALLLENVVGFETSGTWEHVVRGLQACGYEVRQFRLSPQQLGIPNRRPRVYVLARRSPAGWRLHDLEETFPGSPAPPQVRTLGEYLEDLDEAAAGAYAVPRAQLEQIVSLGRRWEVVGAHSSSSSTFTSGYGTTCHDAPRFGPLLGKEPWQEPWQEPLGSGGAGAVRAVGGSRGSVEEGREHRMVQPWEAVRYFTPRELLRLAGFPEGFAFPEGFTATQSYKLVGDSINVDVVAHLLRFLLFEWTSLGAGLVGDEAVAPVPQATEHVP